MADFKFELAVSYLGCTDYVVYGDGPAYRIEVRHEASDYERSIFNGTDSEWQRDCVAAIGQVHRRSESWIPLKPELIAAFNAWRLREHERVIKENDPMFAAPPVVRGAHYQVGVGWVVAEECVSGA
jgi:hypothetical protein